MSNRLRRGRRLSGRSKTIVAIIGTIAAVTYLVPGVAFAESPQVPATDSAVGTARIDSGSGANPPSTDPPSTDPPSTIPPSTDPASPPPTATSSPDSGHADDPATPTDPVPESAQPVPAEPADPEPAAPEATPATTVPESQAPPSTPPSSASTDMNAGGPTVALPPIQVTANPAVVAPGGQVTFSATDTGTCIVQGVDWTLTETDGTSHTAHTDCTSWEGATWTLTIPDDARPGTWTLVVESPNRTGTTTITIAAAPRIAIDSPPVTLTDTNLDGVIGMSDTFHLTATVTNTGNVDLTGAIVTASILDLPRLLNCDSSTVPWGGSITCSADIGVTGDVISRTSTPIEINAVASWDQTAVSATGSTTLTTNRSWLVQLNPPQPVAGSTVTLMAKGFLPSEAVTITVTQGTSAPVFTSTASTDVTGRYFVLWTISPTTPAGSYQVRAENSDGQGADATFSLPAAPRITASLTATFTDTNGDRVVGLGDEITAEATLTNQGNVPLTGIQATLSILGQAPVPCGGVSDLAIGASGTCTGRIPVSLADLVAGQVTVQVRVHSPATVRANVAVRLTQTRTVTVEPTSADPGADVTITAGGLTCADPKTTFTITHGTFAASTTAPCESTRSVLSWTVPASAAPGEYTVTASEATGSAETTFTVNGKPAAQVEVSGSIADTNSDGVVGAGDQITANLTIKNTGTVDLRDIRPTVTFDGVSASSVHCALNTLAVGQQTTCTATRTITPGELAAGAVQIAAAVHADSDAGTSQASATSTLTLTRDRRLSLSPATATPGGEVRATAIGFVPGNTVTFAFGTLVTKTATADADGHASVTAAIPDEAAVGVHVVTASEDGGSCQADLLLISAAGLSLSPTLTQQDTNQNSITDPGDHVAVEVTVTNVGEQPVSDFVATAGGQSLQCDPVPGAAQQTWQCSALLPLSEVQIRAGQVSVTIQARGNADGTLVGNSTTASLTITRAFFVSVSPASARPGDLVTVTARGYLPPDQVAFTIKNAGGPLGNASAVVGADGVASASISVPAQQAGGVYWVTATEGQNAAGPVNVTINAVPGLTLLNSNGQIVDANKNGAIDLGDVVEISTTIWNSGNTPLDQIEAAAGGPLTCSGSGPLAIGGSRNCTGTVPLTAAQIRAGEVHISLTGSGMGGGEQVSDDALVSVQFVRSFAIRLVPSPVEPGEVATLTAYGFLPGDRVTFTVADAEGGTAHTAGADVSENEPAQVRWNVPATQEPGGYQVSASGPGGSVETDFQVAAAPRLTQQISAEFTDTNNDGVRSHGDDITTTVSITNVGNVALNNFAFEQTITPTAGASDRMTGTCQDQSALPPSETRTCVLTSPVTRDELDAGRATVRVHTSADGVGTTKTATAESTTSMAIDSTRHVSASPNSVQQGESVDLSAHGFYPGNTVIFTVGRPGAIVATLTGVADQAARADVRWSVPEAAAPGEYTVVASDQGGQATATFTVTVKPQPPAGGGGGADGGSGAGRVPGSMGAGAGTLGGAGSAGAGAVGGNADLGSAVAVRGAGLAATGGSLSLSIAAVALIVIGGSLRGIRRRRRVG